MATIESFINQPDTRIVTGRAIVINTLLREDATPEALQKRVTEASHIKDHPKFAFLTDPLDVRCVTQSLSPVYIGPKHDGAIGIIEPGKQELADHISNLLTPEDQATIYALTSPATLKLGDEEYFPRIFEEAR